KVPPKRRFPDLFCPRLLLAGAKYCLRCVFINSQQLKPCVLRLAASQHKLYYPRGFRIMFPSASETGVAGVQNFKEIQMITAVVRFLRSWKRYNRSLNELKRLGDRELADIGISRSDIPRVAWGFAQQH